MRSSIIFYNFFLQTMAVLNLEFTAKMKGLSMRGMCKDEGNVHYKSGFQDTYNRILEEPLEN